MIKRKVVVTDDALIVGKTRILWDDITGLREQDDPLLRKISGRFPRAEIFLRGGKVVTISNINILENQSSLVSDEGADVFQFTMGAIKEKASVADSRSNLWFEWRLLLPIFTIEIFVLLGCILAKCLFEKATIFVISGGILGAMAGWVWEKQARSNRFS